jgi:hypothetical protein
MTSTYSFDLLFIDNLNCEVLGGAHKKVQLFSDIDVYLVMTIVGIYEYHYISIF